MLLQRLFVRSLLLTVIFMTAMTGLVFAIGHLSHSPMLLAWVEPIQSSRREGPVAYITDPLRGLNIPVEPPFETSSFLPENANHLDAEPGILYLSESHVNSDNRTTTARLYRYDPQTGDNQQIYETTIQRQLLFYIPNYQLSRSPDGLHYAFSDLAQNRLVAIDTATYDSWTVWQGEPSNSQEGGTSLLSWSPGGEKIAFFDSRSAIYIVNLKGEILERIPVDIVSKESLAAVAWLPDSRHVLFGDLYQTSQSDIIRVFDTISGKANPFTEALEGYNVQYLSSCQGKGDWISFVSNTDKETLNIVDLKTGQRQAYDLNRDKVIASTYVIPDANCSRLIYQRFSPTNSSNPTSDVYLIDLQSGQTHKVLSEVYAGITDDDNALIYARRNEDGTYNVFRLLLDGTGRIEPIAANLPTASVIWMPERMKDGWYTFLENDWTRTSEVMPPVRGNPVIYYDIHSHKARVATPPGVRIMYSWPIP